MRVQGTVTLRYDSTVADLKKVLADIPDSATISVKHYTADPGETSTSTMTFSWDTSTLTH